MLTFTLPETNIENMEIDGWKAYFPFGMASFRRLVLGNVDDHFDWK